ncbi:acyl carrier protein [Micromonospora marina]|uniref:Acyl carrier protein n=1 Tax=Micromonospora marina TaxID=307120 RepID=A0A1C5AJW4_9ACTN|nr:phosphopantetheine-binding protein [Micromonospora marina]SCF45371.1 Acyl carrier protein [Micromonospora marina]
MTGPVGAGATPPVVRPRNPDLSSEYRAPTTELEEQLATLWQARLGLDQIGVDDDFFELGGHSLLAAELLVEIEQTFGVTVPAATLYLDPTVADLAAAIDENRAGSGACD